MNASRLSEMYAPANNAIAPTGVKLGIWGNSRASDTIANALIMNLILGVNSFVIFIFFNYGDSKLAYLIMYQKR